MQGLQAERPSGGCSQVKYMFMEYYYETRRRKVRDYLFGYIGPIASLTHWFAPLVNPFFKQRRVRAPVRVCGLLAQRRFPAFAWQTLGMQAGRAARRADLRIANTGQIYNKTDETLEWPEQHKMGELVQRL